MDHKKTTTCHFLSILEALKCEHNDFLDHLIIYQLVSYSDDKRLCHAAVVVQQIIDLLFILFWERIDWVCYEILNLIKILRKKLARHL